MAIHQLRTTTTTNTKQTKHEPEMADYVRTTEYWAWPDWLRQYADTAADVKEAHSNIEGLEVEAREAVSDRETARQWHELQEAQVLAFKAKQIVERVGTELRLAYEAQQPEEEEQGSEGEAGAPA